MNLQATLESVLNTHPRVHRNLGPETLERLALARGEGLRTAQGALAVQTGRYTGRSPRDKFVVRDEQVRGQVDWGPVNQPMEPEAFDAILQRMLAYIRDRDLFLFDGYAGADPAHRLPLRIVNEFPWQNLFVRQLFLRPTPEDLERHRPELTVLCMPGFEADPERDRTRSETIITLDLSRKLVLIGGTHYAGEIKKAVFTAMNYLLPQEGVLPMHCAANTGPGGDVALFFGLSGTGKTTLSADPARWLIGDDEHGWSDRGVFNLEGGCYAKCIHLSAEREPQIYAAIRSGAVLENVVVDPATGEPDYDSDALTENTRAAYPIDFIPNVVAEGTGGHPSTVIFLTADAFGVLPPIARLTREQAIYYFVSGYTSKLAGTERGVTHPEATFSPCFGGPFLPLPARRYADLLAQKIERHGVRVFLINTGWTGGPFGIGHRIDLAATRRLVSAAISGELDDTNYYRDPIFGLETPTHCPGVPDRILRPQGTWADPGAYQSAALELTQRFSTNIARFAELAPSVLAAGPRP